MEFIRLYKNERAGLLFCEKTEAETDLDNRMRMIGYCLDCLFLRDDPAGSETPWCSLHKFLVAEVRHKCYMTREERRVARKVKFKKCDINHIIRFRKHIASVWDKISPETARRW